jgi:hypothetical protein
MRSCNFSHPEVAQFSGGATQVGGFMMATGGTFEKASIILKNKYLRRLLFIKSFLPKAQFLKIKYFLESWWRR